VELTDPSQSLSLNVSGSFGHPHSEGHVARLPVRFHIVVHDGSTTTRDAHRGWEITGHGGRESLIAKDLIDLVPDHLADELGAMGPRAGDGVLVWRAGRQRSGQRSEICTV